MKGQMVMFCRNRIGLYDLLVKDYNGEDVINIKNITIEKVIEMIRGLDEDKG